MLIFLGPPKAQLAPSLLSIEPDFAVLFKFRGGIGGMAAMVSVFQQKERTSSQQQKQHIAADGQAAIL